jgi:hypothetical protein
MANSISEWFGHRVFPTVTDTEEAVQDQQNEYCPFLSETFATPRKCLKSANSRGVCTVSSEAGGRQRDWVVCPYRTLTSPILTVAARRLFLQSQPESPVLVPAPALADSATQVHVRRALDGQRRVLVYFMDKLGGEIDIPGSKCSPKFKLDTTLVEIVRSENGATIGRHGILEVQTMDFHGSYREATRSLTHAMELHPRDFASQLRANPTWASVGVESPNIANVFKRTIYQVLFKFQVGQHADCAGAILALPKSVWESWQPHLGAPKLKPAGRGVHRFADSKVKGQDPKGWILVLEVNDAAPATPNPIRICRTIEANWEVLAHLAFEKAPQESMKMLTEKDSLRTIIRRRITEFWPGLLG